MGHSTFLACVVIGLLTGGPAFADIRTLNVSADPATGAVVLAWSDGLPGFSVRRSDSTDFQASTTIVHLTRSTLLQSFRDPVLNDGRGYFYLVDDANAEAQACPVVVPPATDGVCDLGTGGGSGPGLLIRGNVLVPGGITLGGSVLIDAAGTITCVGCDCSATPGYASAVHLDCANGVVSPGLINPHDHMTFSENAPLPPSGTRYDHRHEWRAVLSTPSNPHGTGATGAGTRWVEVRMAMSGVTSMAGAGRADGMVRNLDYAGAPQLGLGLAGAELETFPLGDANRVFHPGCTWNYSFTEEQAAGFAAYVPHVAEGIDTFAAEEFFCQSRSTDGAGDFVESNVAHVHAIGLTASDYLRMAHDSAPLVWSPRSNISLYGMTAQVTTFDVLGGTIALGTDWSYSGSINGPRELACADSLNRDYYGGHFSDRQLIEMTTINAARALDADAVIGSIEVGKVADLAIFDGTGGAHYRSIIEADASDVRLTLRGGTALFGEVDVLTGLGQSCETIDVCGGPRALCAAREFSGTSYASLAAVAGGSYPAFFCGTPPGEPTCIPQRPGEYTGLPSGSDADGDAIDDGVDNCPHVFNPVRSAIDGAAQADSDGDGVGDACDPTPLAADLDGDMVPNSLDNCPWDANGAQDDDDADGKGNACDACPGDPNPNTGCPAAVAGIVDIQTGVVPTGAVVTIRGVVTGIGGGTFHVQDPNVTPDTRFSGIMVFPGGASMVAINDLVDVTGKVVEYYGDTEISNVSNVTILGTLAAIPPTPVTVAEAATEDYEGVLVTLTDGVVTDTSFDCSVTPSCSDLNLWEINGSGGVLVYDRYYLDADWAAHIGNLPVSGVMMYRFDRRRILPRTAADFP